MLEFLTGPDFNHPQNPWGWLKEEGWQMPIASTNRAGRGSKKECFYNAFLQAAGHEGLFYAEGLAISGIGIPIHHAWVVDEDGAVHETTWDTGIEYFGVAISRASLMESLIANQRYPGLLFPGGWLNPLDFTKIELIRPE